VRGTLPSAGPAFAANTSRSIVTKAAPASWADTTPAPVNWTGVYLGVNGGFTFGGSDWTDSVTGASSNIFNTSGFVFGGTLGANYQAGSWVFGVELDASAADLNGSANCTPAALVAAVGNCSAKIDMVGTVAGRLGVAFDRLLVYGKAGGAWTNDTYNLTTAGLSFTANETRWGWVLGAGVEYAFADAWSWKLEYDYLGLGTRGVRFADSTGFFNVDTNIREQIHLVKAGINYRFGQPPIGVTY
jgi:outer membrane immunogenic protein